MATSKTAEFVAFYRALETTETSRPPLFRDPLAASFLSRPLARALRLARIRRLRPALEAYADWRAPGARTSAIGRTRFIDDAIRERIGRGVDQLVILGAGYDARAHRLPELAKATVFEVDRPQTQAAKRDRLARSHASSKQDVRYVPVDFAHDDVAERLAAAGWDRARPSIFLWEGVTNYLDEAAVGRILALVGSAAAGTTILFTYIHKGVLDGSVSFAGAQKLVKNVKRLGEPWTFGLRPDELGPFTQRFGLTLVEDLGADEYRRRYLGPGASPHALRGYAFYRIAIAEVRA
jgi:methyltransferase (TIGR00027 family)